MSMKKCLLIVVCSFLLIAPAYCVELLTNTEQYNVKVKDIEATVNYNERSQTFSLKIKNNTKTTIIKVHVTVQEKDVSGYNYSMFDTRQYKYEDLYFDVNISPGSSTVVNKRLVIDNGHQYTGTIFRWARGTDNKNYYN